MRSQNSLWRAWSRDDDALWTRWSSTWGFASLVCVYVAMGRMPTTVEMLLLVPFCYAAGMVTARFVARSTTAGADTRS